VATQSKECVCGRSLTGIASLNPAWGMDVYLLYYVLSGGFLYIGLITRPEESYRVWCVCEALTRRRPWPSRGCCAKGENMSSYGCGVPEILLCPNQCSMYVYVTLFRLHISFGMRIF